MRTLPASPRAMTWCAACLLVAAVVAAYFNGPRGEFVQDSVTFVKENHHIRKLLPLSEAISLPLWNERGALTGRPVLSLSFALNHRLLGSDVWSYRVVNVAIHIAAALLLFGIVRRTVQKVPGSGGESGRAGVFRLSGCEHPTSNIQHSTSKSRIPSALGRWVLDVRCWMFGHDSEARSPVPGDRKWLALAVALLWAVHPLQTESVTYVMGRSESLMGVFYLSTLYCAIRGMTGTRAWFAASIAACALGMGTNAVMVSAPVVVLLYDYVLVSRSLDEALSRHRRLYVGLATTWVALVTLVVMTAQTQPVEWRDPSPMRYALTQGWVILRYLRLSIWPHPLVMDFMPKLLYPGPETVPPLLVLAVLFVLSLLAAGRRHWLGFLGVCFFVILAPTSSFLPLAVEDCYAEQRFYIPLAAVVLAAVLGARYLPGATGWKPVLRGRWAAPFAAAAVAAVFIFLTRARNDDYRSRLAFWTANVEARPQSCPAHCKRGQALLELGRPREAIEQFKNALAIEPEYAPALFQWGNALLELGDPRQAAECYKDVLRVNPFHYHALCGWGVALTAGGEPRKATEMFQQAVKLERDSAVAHCEWGNAMWELDRRDEAMAHYRRGLRAEPDSDLALNCVGRALNALGRPGEAVAYFKRAVGLNTASYHAHFLWANALVGLKRPLEAVAHYVEALSINPECATEEPEWGAALVGDETAGTGIDAYLVAGVRLARRGEGKKAIECFRKVPAMAGHGEKRRLQETLELVIGIK